MFSTKTVAFTTMILLVTKVVLSDRVCFLRLKQIPNIKVVTFQSISIMPSRNSEDSFETPPHTPDQALSLLLTDTLCNCRSNSTWILIRIHSGRVAAVILQPILSNEMPICVKVLFRPNG